MLQLELPLSLPLVRSELTLDVPEERGAIYTREEVVEFILDLVGYTSDRPLWEHRLLEPSFGEGDFLLPAVRRLLSSYLRDHDATAAARDLNSAIRGVELHTESVATTRAKLHALLVSQGVSPADSGQLLDVWLHKGDFLLTDLPGEFAHVVGNPPYVRQELVPDELMAEYRRRYRTIYDRADLYIPFIERCLGYLCREGGLGLICSDRWMKNRYGKVLRGLVARGFHLAHYVDMVGTDAFLSEVTAYPAVTVIRRSSPAPTRVAFRPEISRLSLSRLASAMLSSDPPTTYGAVSEVPDVAKGEEPWILHAPQAIPLVRRLEQSFPSIEECGCSIGIGVATGADRAFIGPFDALDVEGDRKLRLLRTQDIRDGEIRWRGDAVINPFLDDGTLVDLADYPRLRRYLTKREVVIRARSCARRDPARWFRTIDRISPALVHAEKLLIPDIKGAAHIVYEGGGFYPHHNLYYITSTEWPLRALQAVLMSGIANLFVSTYSTEMRGGFLRFQAQYLRRIRLPKWSSLSADIQKRLLPAESGERAEDQMAATFDAYQLSERERNLLFEYTSLGGT